MTDNLPVTKPPFSEILLYQTEDGQNRIQVRLENERAWLSQSGMAELYRTTKQNISLHLKNIFNERELQQESVVKEYLTTAGDGKTYPIRFYNLEAILSVGYRVRSYRGVQFRQWATERLREYLIKGFTLDDERLKEGRTLGADYFDELLERIRDIRASEKRFYQKIRDIYKLSIDYNPSAEDTKEFFRIVQNKLHWDISGMTAAEIISGRADSGKPNMGLTSWKGARLRKGDVTIAKNYLNEDEIRNLNRIVTMYLDYAEDHAQRRQPLYMQDWREKLDAFLRFNEREVLEYPGKVSMEVARELALEEYEKFNKRRLIEEAESEAIEDDREFERIAKSLEENKSRKGTEKGKEKFET